MFIICSIVDCIFFILDTLFYIKAIKSFILLKSPCMNGFPRPRAIARTPVATFHYAQILKK